MYALPGRLSESVRGESAPQNQQPRDRCEKLAKTPPDLALTTRAAVRKFFNRSLGGIATGWAHLEVGGVQRGQ